MIFRSYQGDMMDFNNNNIAHTDLIDRVGHNGTIF
jgi:hypothetical protein